MTDLSGLPAVNASFNAASAFFLVLGYLFIRQRAITAHTMCMLAAFGCSTLFLCGYLTYHFFHGTTPFPGRGAVRVFYFSLLVSHTVLAVAVVPLALTTLGSALKSRFGFHARIAKIALPVWLYVSVTGVAVYWMLYRVRW